MKRFNQFKLFRYLILALGLMIASPNAALALTLDQAKSQGLVGETPSGYLGVVQGGNPAATALMNDINQKRKAKYQEIAKKNGTALNAVEALAGKKAIESTAAGNFVQLPNGQWRKK